MNLRKYTKEFNYNIKLATPIILGMLGHIVVGFVDTMMVGKLGTTELAAVSLGNSIIFLAMSFGLGFCNAITPLAAECDSSNNRESGKSVLKHGIILSGGLSVFLVGILMFSKDIMIMTGQQQNVISLALPYIRLVAISLLPVLIFQSFKQFSDGYSITKYSMYAIFIGNAINIVLNYIFIYGNFGAPKMGVEGAAVGTLVSRFIMPFIMWYFLYKNSKMKTFVVNFNWKSLDKTYIKKLFEIGIPSSLQMVFEAGIFIVATWISGAIGENNQAANQIAMTMSSVTFMISSGMSVVATIRVSNFKGIKDFVSLRRVALSIYLFVIGNQIIMALLYVIFKNVIPLIFIDSDEILNDQNIQFVVKEASLLLIIAGIFQIPDGIQVASLGILRGIQDVKMPTLICFFAYWIIAFPLCYYLGLHTKLETSGIWIGLLAGLTFAAVLLFARFQHFSKRLIEKGEPEKTKNDLDIKMLNDNY